MPIVRIIPTWDMDRIKYLDGGLTVVVLSGGRIPSRERAPVKLVTSRERLGVLEAMSLGAGSLDGVQWPSALAFLHDDVEVHDAGWQETVAGHFESHPKCGLVGFGGALGLGDKDIYKTPYKLRQLARHDFRSNMVDWEIHGVLATIPFRCAVLDGFCLIFRREAYDQMGGWQAAIDLGMPPHHMYDAWACCMMKRLGWEVWVMPVRCHHRGGETATSEDYQRWLRSKGWRNGDQDVHERAHRVIYEEFRDVLPIREEAG